MSAIAAKQPLDPAFYDVDASEEEVSYDRWFRAKVQKSLDNPAPAIPHDEVVKEMALIAQGRRKASAAA